MKKITIAIDGHSSCGKSTMAKDLAREVGYVYVDTGAMYRSVTLYALRNGLFTEGGINEEALRQQMANIQISFKFNAETGRPDTYLNGELVEHDIHRVTVLTYHHELALTGDGDDVDPLGVFQHIMFGVDAPVGQLHLIDAGSEPGPADEVFGRKNLPALGLIFGDERHIVKICPKVSKKSLQFLKKALSLHSQNDGAVAQMVEQWTENPCVGSSILPSTTEKCL